MDIAGQDWFGIARLGTPLQQTAVQWGPIPTWPQLSRVAWARENVSVFQVINRRCPATLLMMTPRRSSGCGACIPELTTRRHRGRPQAPWTIVMLVRKPSQSIHTSRETYTFRRRSRMPCVFSWAPLLVSDTVEVVSSSATRSTEFASTSLYNIYARVPSKLYVAHTHTPVPN